MDIVADGEIVIVGVTHSGRTFRPSDWAERLAGIYSTFGKDNRMNYSPLVQPVLRNGVRCVVIHRPLEQVDPETYSFLLAFARDNNLEVSEGRKAPRPEDAAHESAGDQPSFRPSP